MGASDRIARAYLKKACPGQARNVPTLAGEIGETHRSLGKRRGKGRKRKCHPQVRPLSHGEIIQRLTTDAIVRPAPKREPKSRRFGQEDMDWERMVLGTPYKCTRNVCRNQCPGRKHFESCDSMPGTKREEQEEQE